MEEEGEGFCETKKRNQEIRPKTLNSHPRLLGCPQCTLLPKVNETFNFVLKLSSMGFPLSDARYDPSMYGGHLIDGLAL